MCVCAEHVLCSHKIIIIIIMIAMYVVCSVDCRVHFGPLTGVTAHRTADTQCHMLLYARIDDCIDTRDTQEIVSHKVFVDDSSNARMPDRIAYGRYEKLVSMRVVFTVHTHTHTHLTTFVCGGISCLCPSLPLDRRRIPFISTNMPFRMPKPSNARMRASIKSKDDMG